QDCIKLRDDGFSGRVRILTSCPSCLQGLSRYRHDVDEKTVHTEYIVVEMARYLLGENWMADYVQQVNQGGIERVLL
ncbi:MAG: DUF3400 domain-containing protein, partial [Zoogloeaceae bacterium]|nr:DUF3400 domain-containing protein [Zoogloeaceae bacterium]